MDLANIQSDALLEDITTLLATERDVTAKLLAYLAEVEERRLHLELGHSSMFDFCVTRCKMSEGQAHRRILAARLARRFAVIHSLVASGAVHLSALQMLGERLTDENHGELLAAASGKTKRELELWLAARFPPPRRSRLDSQFPRAKAGQCVACAVFGASGAFLGARRRLPGPHRAALRGPLQD